APSVEARPPSASPAPSPSNGPATTGYTLGIAYEGSEDEARGPGYQERKAVVTAALKEAEERTGRDLPVLPVNAGETDDADEADLDADAAATLLKRHPGMLAVLGETDALDDSTGLSADLAMVDTCEGGGEVMGTFAVSAPLSEVGEQEGRYLRAEGVDTVLVGSDYDGGEGARDDTELGRALRAGGVKAVPSETEPDLMDASDVRRDTRAKKADAVTLPEGSMRTWIDALKGPEGPRLLVQDGYAAGCVRTGSPGDSEEEQKGLPEGSLRFRAFHDPSQKPDCASFPKLCPAPGSSPDDELRVLLKDRNAAELYDATLAVGQALARVLPEGPAPAAARERVRKELADVEVKGLLGTYDFDGHQARERPVWVDRRTGGKWQQLGTVTGFLGTGTGTGTGKD
ncbi:hypothetical protein KDA82_10680, partial [Streptomyces daliensis]|nr:hypothetical protein [Streptomyces daliensis]